MVDNVFKILYNIIVINKEKEIMKMKQVLYIRENKIIDGDLIVNIGLCTAENLEEYWTKAILIL